MSESAQVSLTPEHVQDFRKANKLSQAELAEKMTNFRHTSRSLVNSVETGRRLITEEFQKAFELAKREHIYWRNILEAGPPPPISPRHELARAILDQVMESGVEEAICGIEGSLRYAQERVQSHQHRRGEETSEPQASS